MIPDFSSRWAAESTCRPIFTLLTRHGFCLPTQMLMLYLNLLKLVCYFYLYVYSPEFQMKRNIFLGVLGPKNLKESVYF
jgi:hypothetical protein